MIHIGSKRAGGLGKDLFTLISSPHGRSLPPGRAASSLSAIHRGVHRSERFQSREWSTRDRRTSDRDRGGQFPDRSSPFSGKDTRGRQLTSRALNGAASPRQQQKLRKKLDRKAEQEDEPETGKQTRRKRFLDPESNFGKKSLVYQLKHGAFKDRMASLVPEPVRPLPFRSLKPEPRRHSLRPESEVRSLPSESRSWTDRGPRLSRSRGDSTSSRSLPQKDDVFSEREAPSPERKKPMMAMNIKYTTAASQFLYGKSVVKAALEQGRRKLYNLYIYGGENRRDSKDNYILKGLAERLDVPVTIVPTGEQRLMDKMSMGRPHNGFVLEASPLPQLPVTAMGKLVETPGRLGFHVELDYQSKEEESVNGQDTFISRKSDITPKPFVLLLNEILDPGNLGGLLRTASYLGVDAVGITNRTSSSLTPVVLKSAAGAVEEVTIFTVDSPVSFIEESKRAGWKTYAAVAPPELKLARKHGDKFVSTDFIEQQDPLASDPCILVLGNEGYGLSKPIKVAADYELSIPRFVQHSCVDSLNVSVAAGLLCHAFVKMPSTAAIMPPESRTDGIEEAETEAELEVNSENKLF